MRKELAEVFGARVDAFVAAHREDLINFACELVAAASPNPPGDERAAAAVAERRLTMLGFRERRIAGPRPERANLICRYHTGRPGRTLLLNGHLDTKPAGDLAAWRSDPYLPTIQDGYLFGLGAADMKGPDAALVYGLAAVVAAAADTIVGQVLLILSADEEGQVLDGAGYLVQDVGLRADAALIAEPCGIRQPWEMIPLISRGFCAVRFVVEGTPTHSSIGEQLGAVNASLEISRLLLFLRERLRLHHPATPLCPQGPTINLGATLRGGQALAIVSPMAEFTADIRTLPGMTKAGVAADIEASLAEFRLLRPGVGVTWEFSSGHLGWTEPTQIDPDEPLVMALQGASGAVLGNTPPLGCFPGGTDAIWWQGVGKIPTVPGFGPGMLSNCHQPNECIALAEIVQAARIYARTILAYLSES